MEAGRSAAALRFAALLRGYRQRAQLTQEELAARTQLSVRALRDLESGRRQRPRLDSVRRLADGLGLSGTEALELEAAVPAGPPAPAPPAPPGPPAAATDPPYQLPPDIADFTGRGAIVQRLREHLLNAGPAGATAVAVISGAQGAGKTTLALHVAHALQQHFPHGQLYVDLRGTKPPPLAPLQALGRLLRALEVDGPAAPAELEERASLFRTLVADRRLLVVLDDAGSERQVRPLLPGGGASGVLITSHEQLAGLEGALLVPLEVMEPTEAVELLARIVGPDRVREEQAAAREIAATSGYLPLALRIAGGRLLARPHWKLGRLATRLRNERHRLDELTVGDLDIRNRLSRSYRVAEDGERLAFRRLGLLDAPDVPSWVVAALLDTTLPRAERLVDRLVEAHLVEVSMTAKPPGQVRFRFHDMLRLYARERAAGEESAEQQRGAVERAFGGWLGLAKEACRDLPGGLRGTPAGTWPHWRLDPAADRRAQTDPLTWFEVERPALVAAVRQAGRLGMRELCRDLAAAVSAFLRLRDYYDDWRACLDEALAAVRALGDRGGEAWLLRALGALHLDECRHAEALQCLDSARSVLEDLGDPLGVAWTVGAAGVANRMRGAMGEALACHQRALAVFERAGDSGGRAEALRGLGAVARDQGRLDHALASYEAAAALSGQAGDRFGLALALRGAGVVQRLLASPGQARERLERALAICRELGHRRGEALALVHLAEVHLQQRDTPAALAALTSARGACQEAGERFGAALAAHDLGCAHLGEGALDAAAARFDEALTEWRRLDMPLWEARSLAELGRVQALGGNQNAAARLLLKANALSARLGAPEILTQG